jgi:hypothetical protein
MTPIDWLVIVVVLVAGMGAALAVILSNAAVTRAINHLERSYRRQKTLQLEQLQAQLILERGAELRELLGEDEAWRGVVQQLLADAFPGQAEAEPGAAAWLTLVSVADRPAQFAVGRQDQAGQTFLFTTAREEARSSRPGWLRALLRLNRVAPLDASLSPTARIEVEAIWRHLAERRGLEPAALPRQAEWYLVAPRPRRHKHVQRP